MNFLVKHKKEYFSHTNTGTGEWKKDPKYMVTGEIEYRDSGWNPTSIDLESGESIPMIIARFQMFPNQWLEFSVILEDGSLGGQNTVRFEPKLPDFETRLRDAR